MIVCQNTALAARRLIRIGRKGILATNGSIHDKNAPGWPFTSLVTYATSWGGNPLFLFSTLSQHTQNIFRDSRASLLVDGTRGCSNPQQGPRVCVIGRIKLEDDDRLARRFLARHPGADLYADFSDFKFYTLVVEKIHYVGGFARAIWINKKNAVLSKSKWQELAASEESIINHTNADYPDTLRFIGTKLLKKRGRYWSLTGIDPEGLDLLCGQTFHRLNFDSPITVSEQYRKMLVRLAKPFVD